MIIKTIQDDVFNSEAKHIAFAINTEGLNDSGFAGQVSSKYWSELADCGEHEIGTVLSKIVNGKTFHALVCHSLYADWGENQSKIIKQCFDNIPSNDEPIATIAIGSGFIGKLGGADFNQIVCGMQDSKQPIILHAEYTLDAIADIYLEGKKKQAVSKEKKLALSLHEKELI